MNEYESRQEERRQYYEEKAEQARRQAQQESQKGYDLISMIPPGQPILVGHHSEKRHRRAIERSNQATRRAIDLRDKADYYERKAKGVGKAGISSDDPDAIEKLRAKLKSLEAHQEYMKIINKIHKAYESKGPAALEGQDLSGQEKEAIINYKPRYSWEPHPFPPYAMQNNGGNIRRIKQRIEQLEAQADQQTTSFNIGDVEIIQNAEANRLQVFFPGKPDQDTRDQLKKAGFRWTPSLKCWQAYLKAWPLDQIKKILTQE